MDHSLSLWEVNVGDWKQEAEATVWLKHSAGIFSAGQSNPLAPASFRPAGAHYPLSTPQRSPAGKAGEGLLSCLTLYTRLVCQQQTECFEATNISMTVNGCAHTPWTVLLFDGHCRQMVEKMWHQINIMPLQQHNRVQVQYVCHVYNPITYGMSAWLTANFKLSMDNNRGINSALSLLVLR